MRGREHSAAGLNVDTASERIVGKWGPVRGHRRLDSEWAVSGQTRRK